MLLDGALKIRSKGTPAIFAITRSFLPPSSSLCPAKCSAPELSIPWSYLSKSPQDSTSRNEAQITPLRRTAGAFSHEQLLLQSAPGEQTAIFKASGASVARSSKPPIPDCSRLDPLLSSRYPDHSRTEDSWEFFDGALLCGPIQCLSIMKHRRLFGGPVEQNQSKKSRKVKSNLAISFEYLHLKWDYSSEIGIGYGFRPTADRLHPPLVISAVRGFWMVHSTSCTLDCGTIEHANHKEILDTDSNVPTLFLLLTTLCGSRTQGVALQLTVVGTDPEFICIYLIIDERIYDFAIAMYMTPVIQLDSILWSIEMSSLLQICVKNELCLVTYKAGEEPERSNRICCS
ncbi:hypothetical protein B0H14DRAFT_2598626 [Mycena olivaceomarginata]|nr:hypothetical protein B0H14DRAFT_2598626 [Mycena olivaceomarginata]